MGSARNQCPVNTFAIYRTRRSNPDVTQRCTNHGQRILGMGSEAKEKTKRNSPVNMLNESKSREFLECIHRRNIMSLVHGRNLSTKESRT